MIANIMTILHVITVFDESISNGTLQKGTAISRIDEEDGFQIFKYSNYLTSTSDTDSDPSNGMEIIPFQEEKIYLITGKFFVSQDGSINVTIISNVHVPLGKDDIPVMKPTVHLLGKTMNYAQLTEAGYNLEIQVKPYLSKDQFNSFSVNLTHPVNGRFKNALMKAKKNSTIHVTGIFFFADKKLFCEILEFQFIAAKFETDNTISVPWKSKIDSSPASSSKTKSSIEKRIDLIRENLEKTPPTPPLTNTLKQNRNRREAFTTKISDISRSLLSKDQQIERDTDQEANDIVEIDDDDNESVVEENNKKYDTSMDIPSKTRKSKRLSSDSASKQNRKRREATTRSFLSQNQQIECDTDQEANDSIEEIEKDDPPVDIPNKTRKSKRRKV
ncbi:uncharacterized protein OCT59_002084 [Rhizophagus irregularis]|uniref:Uncharacterized protein n=1 Tax=Rhizophagus irregularis (strain DAOM 181602 / DAOM 197198 / MUCL 43194) TaxID=747089 RepID=U9U5U7_RHIID|nr:hypothetical protein GLOIN_2v1476741 [Rhizophagus irregularis DAOM 181602=DAOM 197198]POG73680.1 hypothetical protein GLOIN_2v1476741 [Rhizophagus irregularis DAOM 181602=DAOM 197198]UZO10503.1 hypothetical protein OCT59_002084 [Rhizophagus irregularis]GBC47309.1 hypothetical protein GLOIN_2v1476741 [Rhizophagus irregularis DAOM 181602=DAOM 197198]CAG8678986.1 2425_t:CDS:1 [Rhizophagus irregularis]|eukprot:XP_025180546.1 hypothetical protein GLOIN_2v1476741 [Rhizophagus irregularis DAOM 181602=DAOM 197198]